MTILSRIAYSRPSDVLERLGGILCLQSEKDFCFLRIYRLETSWWVAKIYYTSLDEQERPLYAYRLWKRL